MKYGDCYIICGLPFEIQPFIHDDRPRCFHCSMCEYGLPRRCKGGKWRFGEDGLLANCRVKKTFKCESKSHKNMVITRVACPHTKEWMKEYIKYCKSKENGK